MEVCRFPFLLKIAQMTRASYLLRKWLVVFSVVAACGPLSPQGEARAEVSGVWMVTGSDTIGTYKGSVELIPTEAAWVYRFVRVIDYASSVVVEGDRSLSWVWEGTATEMPSGAISVTVALQKADFVKRRGTLVRAAEDALPVQVTGTFEPWMNGLTGRFAGLGISAAESWSSPVPSGQLPIFMKQAFELPTHGSIPLAQREILFRTFSSFHALPEVQPYVKLPKFQDPVHTIVIDATDFNFYQQYPTALRVVNKVIDPISLQETLARADAYKWSLSDKAEFYDQDAAKVSIDPATGMLFEFIVQGLGGFPSNDAALWTGAYVASQAYRYRVTRSPEAMANVIRSVEGLMTLMEITGDRRIFARTLRAAQGNPVAPWYPGIGPYASLEWLEGGNNDMFKGAMFGLAHTHALLCEYPSGNDALCARIRFNVTQIADNLSVAQPSGQNRLAAQWMAAYVTRKFSYLLRASGEWTVQAPILANGNVTVVYQDGIADWSGTHLAFVEYMLFSLLAERYPLPGIDAGSTLRQGVEKIYQQFSRVWMGLWSVAFAKLGTALHDDAAWIAGWRLREMPAPQTQMDVDHRIRPDFVMSPFPISPWKGDWTQIDRTQSLRAYPLFEAMTDPYSVYNWKEPPFMYKGSSTGLGYPGADYLIAYWLGRHLGVFAESE
jgi:hypothetical protein